MPVTPYHFGPSGFVGLVFKKYIDLPVFVLANVIVDIEVLVVNLLELGRPIHRYCHTLLIGAVLGAAWALAAYPLRNLFKKIMRILHIPYQTGFRKMLISGILGVWLHAFIDAIYHYDVRLFWPSRIRPLYRLLTRAQMKNICIVLLIAAFIEYVFAVRSYVKQNKAENNKS